MVFVDWFLLFKDVMMLGAVGAYSWSGTVVHQTGPSVNILPFSAFEGILQDRNHSSLLGRHSHFILSVHGVTLNLCIVEKGWIVLIKVVITVKTLQPQLECSCSTTEVHSLCLKQITLSQYECIMSMLHK